MSLIKFKTKLLKINSWIIIHLPKEESAKLPSRGIVAVTGTINGHEFKTVLEPDGKGSHWFRTDGKENELVTVEIEPTKNWPEPEVPDDFMSALKKSPKEYSLWKTITPNAHWDWIRWIRSTNNSETRKKRIEVSISKLSKGMKRPCCFNRNMCCFPDVSKSGVLLN
jgi:hypothetical protein